jgi:predicted aconitase with swiveling domain
MKISGCKKIVDGSGEGRVLVTVQPINFLAMVDAKTGRITDPRHDLYEKSLKGAVLVFPYAIGSSVGAYVFYSLRENGAAPAAIVCTKADITTASGCAVAKIPVVDLPKGAPAIKQGSIARVDADAGIITIKKLNRNFG